MSHTNQNQNNEEIFSPQPKSPPKADQPRAEKTLLTIIIAVLASAIVVGLATYFVMAKVNSDKQTDLEKQVEQLQEQVNQLSGQTNLPPQNQEVDSDNDGLSDRRELELMTDPNNPDTDGDGYLDGQEVANGYDPLVDEKKQAKEPQNKFTNWQTYQNDEYGYEIKYPEGWFVYDDACECMCENSPSSQAKSYNRIRIQSFKRPDECGYSGLGGDGIKLSIYITDKLKNLDDWSNNMKAIDPTMKVNIIKNINVGGVVGKELTLSCDCLIGVDFYRIIEKNNMIYEFSISSQNADLNGYFDQILSTFKFLD